MQKDAWYCFSLCRFISSQSRFDVSVNTDPENENTEKWGLLYYPLATLTFIFFHFTARNKQDRKFGLSITILKLGKDTVHSRFRCRPRVSYWTLLLHVSLYACSFLKRYSSQFGHSRIFDLKIRKCRSPMIFVRKRRVSDKFNSLWTSSR